MRALLPAVTIGWWSYLTLCRKHLTERTGHARKEGAVWASQRRGPGRGPRHTGRGVAGDRDRSRHLVMVCADDVGRESRRQYQVELWPGNGFRRQDHRLGAGQAFRGRITGRTRHGGHRVDRRSQGRRYLCGPGRAQLVREYGRLGWSVRGPQLRLDHILPKPAALFEALWWTGVLDRGAFGDVQRQRCLGPLGRPARIG